MVADHWFMQIENVLEAMEITSDTTRVRLAAFQLEGEARVWWRWVKTSRYLEVMTWAEFQELFMGKYFPETARHAKAQEFLELKQRAMTVMDYVARFTELAIAEIHWTFRDTREDRHRSVPVGFTTQHDRCPRGISRLHASEIYSRSSSCGGLGTD